MAYLVVGLAVVLAGYFIILVVRGTSDARQTLLKGMASASFVGVGIVFCCYYPMGGVSIAMLLCGLVFGMAGDILLALKGVYKSKENTFLLVGLLSFLVGHIFYIALFVSFSSFNFWIFLFAPLLTVALMLIAKLLKCKFGVMYAPVVIYCLVISGMLFCAINCLIAGANVFTIVMLVAAVLFFLSDVVLCFIYFNIKTPKACVPLNLSLYYSAQILLALAPLFMALA